MPLRRDRDDDNHPDIFVAEPAQAGIVGKMPTLMSVAIYGLGHLGSLVAWTLSKLGVRDFSLNDFDTLEERNISGSIYERAQIGMSKTGAMRQILVRQIYNTSSESPLNNISGVNKISIGYMVGTYDNLGFPYQPFCDFYILATDGAESRKWISETIFEHWDLSKHHPMFADMNPMIIDVRSAGPKVSIMNLPVLDDELRVRYLKELDRLAEEPGEIACDEANIIQVSSFVGAVVAQIVTSVIKGNVQYKWWQGSLETLDTHPFILPVEENLPM
jgi:hypothetical protein